MFVNADVPTCPAVLRRLMYSCMCRLTTSMNSIILVLTNQCFRYVELAVAARHSYISAATVGLGDKSIKITIEVMTSLDKDIVTLIYFQ